jgi:hypothetical protein
MASQAAIFAETIAGMKKAVKRKAYGTATPLWPDQSARILLIVPCDVDSDSDSSVEQLMNRGNKLRKRARYVHDGQLAPPTGPQVYKRVGNCLAIAQGPIHTFGAFADTNTRESNTPVFSGIS